jgi:hypothetical protein
VSTKYQVAGAPVLTAYRGGYKNLNITTGGHDISPFQSCAFLYINIPMVKGRKVTASSDVDSVATRSG